MSGSVYCPRCGAKDQFGIIETSWGPQGPRFLDCSCQACGVAITNYGKNDKHQAIVSQADWETIVKQRCE